MSILKTTRTIVTDIDEFNNFGEWKTFGQKSTNNEMFVYCLINSIL